MATAEAIRGKQARLDGAPMLSYRWKETTRFGISVHLFDGNVPTKFWIRLMPPTRKAFIVTWQLYFDWDVLQSAEGRATDFGNQTTARGELEKYYATWKAATDV